MDTTRFGAALRHARENYVDPDNPDGPRGLTGREAARRAGISESRWRHLETGVQYVGGQARPTSTKAATAATVARVVGLDVAEALRLAGFRPEEYGDLTRLGDEAQTERVPGFSRLTPRQRTKVIELVAAILDTDEDPIGVQPGTAPPDIAERGTVLGRRDDDTGSGRAGEA